MEKPHQLYAGWASRGVSSALTSAPSKAISGVLCPCSFGRQEDRRTVRHFADKAKLSIDAPDCDLPVFSRRGRRRNRVADEVRIDQKCLNPCNFSQEIQARIPIRGLIERER
jgi:predicted kinase